MDIIEVITADHAAAAELFGELDGVARDDRRTSDAMHLVVRLTVAIKVHCHAEEHVLYEAMRTANSQLAELALEGPYEHQALEMMLDKLVLHRPGPELCAILHVARHEFAHHARDDEEQVMLPAVQAWFTEDQRRQLGLDMLAEKRRIRSHIERLVGPPPRVREGGSASTITRASATDRQVAASTSVGESRRIASLGSISTRKPRAPPLM